MAKKKNKISTLWLDRAKAVGLSPEQIATYTDEKALIAACNRIKPQATSYPPVSVKPKPAPKKIEIAKESFSSVISLARSRHTSRTSYDEGQINNYMVRNRINPKQVKTVSLRRIMQADKGLNLITYVCIEYVK